MLVVTTPTEVWGFVSEAKKLGDRRKAVTDDPDNPAKHADLAQSLIDAGQYFPDPEALPSFDRLSLSALANGLVGSEILKIAAEIRALQRAGKSICNLTVGDFSSKEFPVPAELDRQVAALPTGEPRRVRPGRQWAFPPS